MREPFPCYIWRIVFIEVDRETSDTPEEMVYDHDHKSVEVYLAISGVGSQSNSIWRRVMRGRIGVAGRQR